MIYLHELVNTVPGRSEDYLDSMAGFHHDNAAPGGDRDGILGLFTVVEATGTWPLGVNIWQKTGWQGQSDALERQFKPRKQDPGLKQWWLTNLHLRTGGFDRILESTDYSRDVAGLRAADVGGKLFLQQIVRIAPGKVEDYLDAFGQEGVPAIAAAGGQLVGAYRVRLSNQEAITLLAFREAADFAGYLEEWHASGEGSALRRWRAREDAWVRSKESLVMKPRHYLGAPWGG